MEVGSLATPDLLFEGERIALRILERDEPLPPVSGGKGARDPNSLCREPLHHFANVRGDEPQVNRPFLRESRIEDNHRSARLQRHHPARVGEDGAETEEFPVESDHPVEVANRKMNLLQPADRAGTLPIREQLSTPVSGRR
jgi:hypothetical protein